VELGGVRKIVAVDVVRCERPTDEASLVQLAQARDEAVELRQLDQTGLGRLEEEIAAAVEVATAPRVEPEVVEKLEHLITARRGTLGRDRARLPEREGRRALVV
jgi:hypothetical protein